MNIRLLPGLALLAAPLLARAEWDFGRGALAFEASASGIYDSNLYAAVDAVEDYALAFEPTLRYRRNDSRIKTDGHARYRIRRYLDHPEINSEDPEVHMDWRLLRGEGRTVGANFMADYSKTSDAVLEVNQRVRAEHLSLETGGEVQMARRHVLGASLAYRDQRRDFGSDQNVRTGRVNYRFMSLADDSAFTASWTHQRSDSEDALTGLDQLRQTARTLSLGYDRPLYHDAVLNASWGYRWLERDAAAGLPPVDDRSGAFVGLTLDGPFLPRAYFPKTTGRLRVAYEQADVPGLQDSGNERLVGEFQLGWQARPRTRLTLGARREQELSITNHTLVTAGGEVGWAQEVGRFTRTELSLSYLNADFIGLGRRDDRIEASFTARYARNREWPLFLRYQFLDSESTDPVANYQRHVVTITLSHLF